MKKLFLMFAAAGVLAACENPVEEITVDKTLYATGIEVVAENGAAQRSRRAACATVSLAPAGANRGQKEEQAGRKGEKEWSGKELAR